MYRHTLQHLAMHTLKIKFHCVSLVFDKYSEVVMMLTIVFSQGSVLTLDDSSVDGDQVDYLIKFCPTKEEMELLKVQLD